MKDMKDAKDVNQPSHDNLLPAWQRIVLATADVQHFPRYSRLLPAWCREPLLCLSVREVMSALSVHDVAIVVCSASLADGSFRDLFRVLDLARWHVPVIVAFPGDQQEQPSEAILLGAYGCVTPSTERNEISRILDRALAQSRRFDTQDSSQAAHWITQ